jgi:hypothetical protein
MAPEDPDEPDEPLEPEDPEEPDEPLEPVDASPPSDPIVLSEASSPELPQPSQSEVVTPSPMKLVPTMIHRTLTKALLMASPPAAPLSGRRQQSSLRRGA